MCTSIAYVTKHFYFGRNLDLEYSFGEEVVITPRNYRFTYKKQEAAPAGYAMVGMANVVAEYPLYAEAVNEKGLGIAGLNFPGNAFYDPEESEEQADITPYELIPWVLSRCATVEEAEALLRKTHLVAIPFNGQLPLAPLHWHIADRSRSIVAEPMREGLRIHEDPVNVLTNNPAFDFQLMNLNQYMGLSAANPENRFGKDLPLQTFGQGMGGIGLPGDFSPASRFVKAAFLLANSRRDLPEQESVTQFFHILEGVAMVEGSVLTPEGRFDKTTYSCCVDGDRGIYYYKTYGNSRITAVDMGREDLTGEKLLRYPLEEKQQIAYAN